ncbi:MAG: acetyl ornithine aminotransferase family protein [candidate division Zixibacteria bacterium]|nr:acetyl ornithine aminotransferase family protein [candidate division Zixibacteria bacterium]
MPKSKKRREIGPNIKTKLPGPIGKRLIEKDKKFVSPSYTRAYPAMLSRAAGAFIWDVDGNSYIDFHSGIGVNTTGNCHPRIVAAIENQARKAIHIATADFYHPLTGELAEKLSALAPGQGTKRVFFGNSGTEAVECAFKLARYLTRRPRMLAFIDSFHGRTMGALSLTCSKLNQRKHFAPLVPEVTHVPYPNCYRCPLNLTHPSCELACVDYIEQTVFKKVAPAEDVAAIFVEPIQGEGGYIVPPPGYHQKLKKLMEKYGILFVADEVQSGVGKTGKFFAIQHWGVTPDIIAVSKALASGLPLGACIAPDKLMQWPPGAHSTTFGGNPVACAAAIETINLLEEGLMTNARRMGEFLTARLLKMKNKYEIIGDVRGKGLMIGIEFVKSKKTKERAPDVSDGLQRECFEKGLMLLTCGENTIRFVPPLIINEEIGEMALAIFETAVAKFQNKKRK